MKIESIDTPEKRLPIYKEALKVIDSENGGLCYLLPILWYHGLNSRDFSMKKFREIGERTGVLFLWSDTADIFIEFGERYDDYGYVVYENLFVEDRKDWRKKILTEIIEEIENNLKQK